MKTCALVLMGFVINSMGEHAYAQELSAISPEEMFTDILLGDTIKKIYNINAATVDSASVDSGDSTQLKLSERNSGVEISWSIKDITEPTLYIVERSTDGNVFSNIGRVRLSQHSNPSYYYFDNNLPAGNTIYYRLKQCNAANDSCKYSSVKSIRIANQKPLKVFPQPGSNTIRVSYSANNAGDILMIVYTNNGNDVYREKRRITEGINDFNIVIENLPRGFYVLKIVEGAGSESCSFVR